MFKHFFLVVCFSSAVAAEPIVIRDYGGRDSGVPDIIGAKLSAQRKAVSPSRPLIFDDTARYPMQSNLRPGYIDQPQRLQKPVIAARPFFIIGSDPFSRDWLEKNKAYLNKIGAQGLATNINNREVFEEMELLAAPLSLIALPVDEIAEILQLSVYPVLVTGEEIAQ